MYGLGESVAVSVGKRDLKETGKNEDTNPPYP